MEKQSVLTEKKKRGPVPTGKGTLVGVRLKPSELAGVDGWIAEQDEPKPTRPEVLRLALKDWLGGIGHTSAP